MLLVYGLTQTNNAGWGSAQTIGVLLALGGPHGRVPLHRAALALAARPAQLLPPARRRPGRTSIGFGLGTMVFGMFFLLSLYMQQVLGFSAVKTGLGYLAVALTAVVASGVAQALVTKIGVRPVLAAGMLLLGGGPRLLHADLGRRLLRRRPAARLPADRRRARLLLRAGLDRRARGVPRRGGRPRIRSHQHVPADRRRARPRHPDRGRDQPHGLARRKRHGHAGRPLQTGSRRRSG